MRIDKNKAVIDYLLDCSDIQDRPLYFNLINAEDDSIQMLTTVEDKTLSTAYIDGSISKRYTFTIVIFKSISDNELVKSSGISNENVDELDDIQKLIDWIQEQNDLQNYPDFGENCYIDKIDTTTDAPRFDGIDTESNPPIAMYSISIIIEYLDTNKVIFK